MAKITLLHWNIRNFSRNKLNNKNGPPLINYIASVVAESKANMISLIELKPSAAAEIIAELIPAIDKANEVLPPTEWRAVKIDSRHKESYVVLYQLGNDFEPLKGDVGDDPINYLTQQKIVDGKPGGTVPFNRSGGVGDPSAKSGGRTPYYVVFRTTDSDPKQNFSIVACHIMMGKYTEIGVRSAGEIAQSRVILNKGVKVEMQASFTAGDFNIDFNPAFPESYNKLLDFAYQATNFKTSLKVLPPDGPQLSYGYRSKAFDNIFQYHKTGLAKPDNGFVFDLINASAEAGSGLFTEQATPFKREAISRGRGKLIKKIPPVTLEDSWRLVLYAISDHLPVYVSMII